MQNRWVILFVLFFARTVMAFQFQSVAALSPLIVESYAITLIDIGLLIGLYLGPGIIVAMLGGTLAAWIGDWRTGVLSLALMAAGALMIAFAPALSWVMAGRVVSGIGGVVVNVVMTKMVIDWFAGRRIATAMAIFISSWPLGIALALLILPGLAGAGGLALGWTGVTIATVAALLAFAGIYRSPPGAVRGGRLAIRALPWRGLTLAAVTWGLYNTALAMVFGFGTLVMTERGLDVTGAGSATSLYMLTLTVSVPLGGWVADWSGRRDMVILAGLLVGILSFPLFLALPLGWTGLAFGAAGFLVGLSAGPIVSLASYVLGPETRAFGMGIYYAIYYLLMMIAPPLAGALAERLGDVAVTFLLGTAMLAVAVMTLAAFRGTTRTVPARN